MSTVEQAEAHLGARAIEPALEVYAELTREADGEADRVDGGRWMCHMLLGEYEAAWRCSDAIRGRGGEDVHRFWTGEPITGKRLMMRCLHGYGDTVMYLRWLPELRRCCSEVLVQACPEMLPLIEAMVAGSNGASDGGTAPIRVVSWTVEGESDREMWDVQAECAELPFLFRTTTATLPEPVALVFPETVAHGVRMRMGERTRPRVGLVWTGSNYDPARSIPLAQFRQLLENQAVEFWSLQAPENNAEWVALCDERGWSQRTFYTEEERGGAVRNAGIADMAAVAQEMDAVITIDTMAAHVAASLGLPTWLLLKREADWRWMLQREDSPWYPTMRLFRQSVAGDWDEPLTRVCEALRDMGEEMRA